MPRQMPQLRFATGDARAAVRALPVANGYLLERLDQQRALLEQSVSRGFVRGRLKGKEKR